MIEQIRQIEQSQASEATRKAIASWGRAEDAMEEDSRFSNQLLAETALDEVTARARASVPPHVATALVLAGFRKAKDTYYTEGRDGLDMTLESLKRDLRASACSCGGTGHVIDGHHPGDPAGPKPCPICNSGDGEAYEGSYSEPILGKDDA
jgi:hypothetical protein